MKPVRYRWLAYAPNMFLNVPTRMRAWRRATEGKLRAACRAMKVAGERLQIEYDNGQTVYVTVKPNLYCQGAIRVPPE